MDFNNMEFISILLKSIHTRKSTVYIGDHDNTFFSVFLLLRVCKVIICRSIYGIGTSRFEYLLPV